VDVEHGLPCIRTTVENGAEPVGQRPFARGQLARGQKHFANDRRFCGGNLSQRGNVPPGNDQDMGRGHRVDIAEGDQLRFIEHDVGRYLAACDPAENATRHGRPRGKRRPTPFLFQMAYNSGKSRPPGTTVKLSAKEFKSWDNKCITLLGMSGVGKTRLALKLRKKHWFHYSGDYRIGTRYLDEPILDNIKQQAMQIPFLHDLLRTDSIYIRNNITVDNLQPVSSFLGKLGNPEQGGLPLGEFKHRQALHRDAEIAAMRDVPEFIRKSSSIYGYRHFVNDAGGSLCELDDPATLKVLADNTLILYIKANEKDEQELIRRAEEDPKPLYYRESFLDEQLQIYLREKGHAYVAEIEPDDFVRWMFPRLFYSRIPRYEAIANEHGYTLSTEELKEARDEGSFLRLVERVLERHG
jgi:hypothetical protein